jgi:PAS domain S-box-containing protein
MIGISEDIIKAMNDGLVLTDTHQMVIFVNPGFVALSGYGPEEIIGRKWLDIIPSEHYDMVLEAERRRARGLSDRYEMVLQHKNGEKREVLIDASPRFDKKTGKFSGTIGFVTDITQRKKDELALQKNLLRYRLLFEQSPIGVFHFDNDGTIVDCNENFVKIIGSSRKALMGLNMLGLPDNKLVKQLQNALNGYTGFYEGVYHSVTAEKSTPVKVYVSPLLDKDGRSFGCVGIVEDVTEQKQAREAVRKKETLHRKMLANIGDVIVIIDRDCINRYKSPNIEKWFGWKPEEVVGTSTWENIHPDDLTPAQRFFAGILQIPGKMGTIECRYRCKDGNYKWIEFTGTNLLDDPDIQGVLGNYKDITERKNAEADREKLQAQLTQAQKMESVGRLAGGVAHDFNNMLGVILGYTELALLRTDDNHKLIADLKEIQKAAHRSSDITKQLLAFARKQTISPRKLDLNDTVESMLKMLRRLIGENIDLVWQPSAHLWPVKLDPTQIDQILANLCVNARDAIEGVGKITIDTGNKTFDAAYCKEHSGFIPGDFVQLSVSDNGSGMDRETLDNLFEPFFTTKEVGKGTGLGLATIYGIVKQNNGFIDVYSEPGQGSTFRIYLPRLVQEKEVFKSVSGKKATAGGTETILLVEDEPTILSMTQKMLERKGYSVLPAVTPAEAIDLAGTHTDPIHLLMTDVVMPEMNGRDLAGQIKGLCPDIRLLFMSGYPANVIAHQGMLDDGVAFIQKPFSMGDLTEKLREVLDENTRSQMS